MLGNIWIRPIAAALAGFFVATGSLASEEPKCALRAGYFETNPNRQFAGMFRIVLDPPDIGDFAAVQRHIAFSKVWGDIIFRDIHSRSRGLCTALTTSLGFPDLRLFLAVNRSTSRIEREKAVCTQLLQDVLTHSEPGEAVIERSIAWYMGGVGLIQPGYGDAAVSPLGDAVNVSQIASQLIYEKGSALHTLVIARQSTFAVDAAGLREWILSQRQPQRSLLEAIPHCLWPGGDLSKSADIPAARAESGILPPGEFSVTRPPNGLLPPGPLRYVVIVGDPAEPPGLAVSSEVQRKYCDKDHTFSFGGEPSERRSITVQPNCSMNSIGDLDAWNIIYCDPKDCTSEPVERAVMTAIAADPEILDFAKRSSNTAIPRGPYLISIK